VLRSRATPNVTTVTGDDVRGITFLRKNFGYEVGEVDEVLWCIAAELDAGCSPVRTIDGASFPTSTSTGNSIQGYDIDAVDWVLGEISSTVRQPLSAASSNEWFLGAVVNQLQRKNNPAIGFKSESKLELSGRLSQECNDE
jgi:hypothetical protein